MVRSFSESQQFSHFGLFASTPNCEQIFGFRRSQGALFCILPALNVTKSVLGAKSSLLSVFWLRIFSSSSTIVLQDKKCLFRTSTELGCYGDRPRVSCVPFVVCISQCSHWVHRALCPCTNLCVIHVCEEFKTQLCRVEACFALGVSCMTLVVPGGKPASNGVFCASESNCPLVVSSCVTGRRRALRHRECALCPTC